MEFIYVLDERSGLHLRKEYTEKVYPSIWLYWKIKATSTYFIFGIMNYNDLTQYCSGDKIEKDEMGRGGGVCSAYG